MTSAGRASHGVADAALHIYRGDTFVTVFEFADGDGTPLVLPESGWRAHMVMSGASEPVVLDVAAEGNRVTVSLPATVTATLDSVGRWDLELTDGDIVRTYVRGSVTVERDVTR